MKKGFQTYFLKAKTKIQKQTIKLFRIYRTHNKFHSTFNCAHTKQSVSMQKNCPMRFSATDNIALPANEFFSIAPQKAPIRVPRANLSTNQFLRSSLCLCSGNSPRRTQTLTTLLRLLRGAYGIRVQQSFSHSAFDPQLSVNTASYEQNSSSALGIEPFRFRSRDKSHHSCVTVRLPCTCCNYLENSTTLPAQVTLECTTFTQVYHTYLNRNLLPRVYLELVTASYASFSRQRQMHKSIYSCRKKIKTLFLCIKAPHITHR